MSHNTELADQACYSCRKTKRKCTKERPQCFLCRKVGRPCDYSYDIGAFDPTEVEQLRERITELESQLAAVSSPGHHEDNRIPTQSRTDPQEQTESSSRLITLFFLDSPSFQYKKLSLGKHETTIPKQYWDYLGQNEAIQRNVEQFFETVHKWFPIVSKLGITRQLTLLKHNPDAALVCLSMRLHNLSIYGNGAPTSDMYEITKSCYRYVEGQNVLSIRLLQAAVLIGLYECVNAIYPAAYLTVGHCARLGYALGIHAPQKAPQLLPPPDIWSEHEERRRVWWAIIVLDRYVNIGNRKHPFATEDADPDSLLPVNDKDWDNGELSINQPLALSMSSTIRAFPFARTCQASHLLSRVLRHMDREESDLAYQYQEALQLHRTVQSLSQILTDESDEFCGSSVNIYTQTSLFTAQAFCYSALLNLYDMYSCIDITTPASIGMPGQVELQQTAITGLKDLSVVVHQFAKRIKEVVHFEGLLRVSPFVIECLYQAAANHAWYVRETENQEFRRMMVDVKEVLQILGQKWGAAREYVRILEGRDVLYSGGCHH